MRRPVVTGFLILTLQFLGIAGVEAGLGFSEPKAMNSDALLDGGADYLPNLATDGNGVWICLWYSAEDKLGTNGDFDIFWSRSGDNGDTWSDIAPFNPNATLSGQLDDHDSVPHLAADGNGTWLAVWQSRTDTGSTGFFDWDIVYSRSVDDGLSWSPIAYADSNSADIVSDDGGQPASNGNGVWIITWASRTDLSPAPDTDYDILAARSLDNAQSWEPSIVLNSGALDDDGWDVWPTIATDRSGRWVTVWSSNSTSGTLGPDYDIFFSTSDNDGMTWADARVLNGNAEEEVADDGQLAGLGVARYGPKIATDRQGTWIAVWDSRSTLGGTIGADADILYAVSTDNADSWSYPRLLNSDGATDPLNGAGHDFHPYIQHDGAGTWVVIWTTQAFSAPLHTDTDLAVSRSTDNGATWTEMSPLNGYMQTDIEGVDDLPWLEIGQGGRAICVWNSSSAFYTEGDYDVLYAVSDDLSLPPDPPLSASDQDLLEVLVDVILGKKILDQNGDGVVDIADVILFAAQNAP